jgi:hypothetical protein
MSTSSRARALLASAATSTVVTTVLASLLSRKETGHTGAALNATSHILWGDRAFDEDDVDVSHTLVGGMINAAAMASWGTVYALLPFPRSFLGTLAKGATVSALAYATDYYVVPKRLTPGFEERLSPLSLGLVYAGLAAALGAGDWLARKRA